MSALLFLHGLVHVVGFVGPLQLVPEAPYQTMVFGKHVPSASPTARSVAALWLLLALALSVASVAVFVRASWWFPFTALVLMTSSLLCLTAWPLTKAGLALNAGLLLSCSLLERAQLWADLTALLRALPF